MGTVLTQQLRTARSSAVCEKPIASARHRTKRTDPAEMSCAASAVFSRPGPPARRGAPLPAGHPLRCEAAGIKTGRLSEGENTKEGNGEGFETEFLFDLGGATPRR